MNKKWTAHLAAMWYPNTYRDSSQLCYTFGLIVEYKSNTVNSEETHYFIFHSNRHRPV